MANQIKFTGSYPKLHNQTTAELISVRELRIDRFTPKELIEYDTKKDDGTYYKLKTGNYIQLIFIGNFNIPFTTIRARTTRWGSDKKEYYDGLIGEIFEVVTEGENEMGIKREITGLGLRKYKCHKEVMASMIYGIMEEDDFVILVLDGTDVKVSKEDFDRMKPEVCGYYVKYNDGYVSYSPAKAFEEGYTLVE